MSFKEFSNKLNTLAKYVSRVATTNMVRQRFFLEDPSQTSPRMS